MSENIYFSKSIKLSDIKKKCKQLKVGKQENLYGDSDIPTYSITHKEFPGEKVYVIFNRYEDKSLNAKLGEKCDDKEFCEVERFYENGDYHILLILAGTFDIEYITEIDEWSEGNFDRFVLQPHVNNEFAPIFEKVNFHTFFKEKDEIPYEGNPKPVENLFE